MAIEQDLPLRRMTESDFGAVARIHCEAFRSSGLSCFGEALAREYYEWQVQQLPKLVGFVAVKGDRVLGYAFCGDTFLSATAFMATRRKRVAAAFLSRPMLMFDRRVMKMVTNAFRRLIRPMKRRSKSVTAASSVSNLTYWVEALAVDPAAQGLGLGKRLMCQCVEWGASLGYSHFYLAVETKNERAISLYERLGWKRVLNEGRWSGRMTLTPAEAASLDKAC